MFRYNSFTIIVLLVFSLLLTSCGKNEVSLSPEVSPVYDEKNSDIYTGQQSTSYKTEVHPTQQESANRKGLINTFFKKSKGESDKLDNDINVIPENKPLKKEAINKVVKTSNGKIDNENSSSWKNSVVIKNLISFFRIFTNDNPYIVENIKYPVDSLSVVEGLNLAVLKIPDNHYKKENDICYSEDTRLLKSMSTALPKNLSLNIMNDPIYVDIFGINSVENNQFKNDLNKPNKTGGGELSPSDIYKNYFIALKFEGLLTNYNEVIPNKSLTLLHKTLTSQLLLKNGKIPQVLYIFYRQTNQDIYISTKQQLFLTSYLNNLRSYIYSKNLENLYVQEVQFVDLPVDEILLILKPITKEQYNTLPKQVNVFNAKKIDIKTWLEKNKNIGKKSNNKL